jgi:hypothetical protein
MENNRRSVALIPAISAFIVLMTGATIAWFIYLLLFSDAAWIHPELLGSSAYVWLYPGQETLGQMLRKVFDWKGFDPNVNRVRPFNDVFEVIDAIVRPHITYVVGPQAALNVSTVATMILAPVLLYAWLKRVVGWWELALILSLIFVASTGFLSLTVVYMHPAKKVNLVLLCAALLFAQRDHDRAPGRNFLWLQASLFCSFFADELGLANYPIIGIIYWRTLFTNKERIAAFAALPILFLAVTTWVLPAIYLRLGVHGAWDALADTKKFSVFGYLTSLEFYQAALIQLARSVMSTVGLSTHTRVTEAAALILVCASLLACLRTPASARNPVLGCQILLSTAALVAASTYATLLDWYPFPHQISYMGSFNYYYHSSVIVSVIVWIAFLLRQAIIGADLLRQRAVMWVVSVMGGVIVVFNFATFDRVNRLVEIIHYYPYSRETLFSVAARIKHPAKGQQLMLTVTADPAAEQARFEGALRAQFGGRSSDNGYVTTFEMVQRTPIMSDATIALFFHAFYPFAKIAVNVRRQVIPTRQE